MRKIKEGKEKRQSFFSFLKPARYVRLSEIPDIEIRVGMPLDVKPLRDSPESLQGDFAKQSE
jgi:hypothetical protein